MPTAPLAEPPLPSLHPHTARSQAALPPELHFKPSPPWLPLSNHPHYLGRQHTHPDSCHPHRQPHSIAPLFAKAATVTCFMPLLSPSSSWTSLHSANLPHPGTTRALPWPSIPTAALPPGFLLSSNESSATSGILRGSLIFSTDTPPYHHAPPWLPPLPATNTHGRISLFSQVPCLSLSLYYVLYSCVFIGMIMCVYLYLYILYV